MSETLEKNARPSRYDEATKSKVRALIKERNAWLALLPVILMGIFYSSGLLLISSRSLASAIGGIALTSEALILAWYLSHDCAHLLVFKNKDSNLLLGEILSFFNGTAYFAFKNYRTDHLRHHAEHVDLIGIDIAAVLHDMPAPIRDMILGLEKCYIPSVYILVKLRTVLSTVSLRNRDGRRALLALVTYTSFFALLGARYWPSLLYYLAAITVRVHCVRFVDAFQHTFEHVDHRVRSLPRGRSYEQRHTFSFPVARRFKIMNRVILNFGFHNAHHAIPSCPWYNLERLDVILSDNRAKEAGYAAYEQRDVGFLELIRGYHRYRIHRIICGNSGLAYRPDTTFTMAAFSGAFTDNLLG